MPKLVKPPTKKPSNVKPNNVIQMPNVFDPEQVNTRLYKQVSVLLKQLEHKDSHEMVTIRERIAALIACGRIQQMFIAMRKATGDVGAGATVKKFESAFSDAAGRGKSNPRFASTAGPEPDDWFESAERANDEDYDGDAA